METIVIKVGTAVLSSKAGINKSLISKLTSVIVKLKQEGHKIVLISSGAMALGAKKSKIKKRPQTTLEKQAACAIGQPELMKEYDKFFSKKKIVMAQMLLTRDGMSCRKYYSNARATLKELLKSGVVPVINENDAVAHEELTFGDNDTLGAQVASLVKANRLIILTDEKGLYDKNPKKYKTAKLITEVEKVTPQIQKIASGKGSEFSTGGMLSKVLAAKLATKNGITTHVILGNSPGKILDLLNGKRVGTVFLPMKKKPKRKS